MVPAHRRGPERPTGKPGPVERLRPCIEVLRVCHHGGEHGGEGAQCVLSHGGQLRGDIWCVQRLDGVRERVDAAGPGDVARQRGGEGGVVEHRAGQHPRVPASGLTPLVAQPPDRGHLAAGVGGGHRQDRQPGFAGDRLGHPGRGAAAEGEQNIGT